MVIVNIESLYGIRQIIESVKNLRIEINKSTKSTESTYRSEMTMPERTNTTETSPLKHFDSYLQLHMRLSNGVSRHNSRLLINITL